jgi:dolichyl-phosphate beta-glucosyltransferase
MPLVSIIIPALNEESRLPNTLELCIKFLKQQEYASEIIVVTDGSTDRTQEVAESFISSFPSLRVISFSSNRGRGFAIKVGMLEAKGQYRLYIDADGAVPIEFLSLFLAKCQAGHDVVIGSRTHKESKILRRQPLLRHNLGIVFRFIQKGILGMPYRDTQCGFKLFTDEATHKLFSKLTYECSFSETELMYIAHKMNLNVYQHPVTWTHDPYTRLPIGFLRSIELFIKLLMIRKIHSKA